MRLEYCATNESQAALSRRKQAAISVCSFSVIVEITREKTSSFDSQKVDLRSNPQLPAAASRSDPIPETPYLLTHPWCRKKHLLSRAAVSLSSALSSTQSLSSSELHWHHRC